jgi:methylenetetrahydrofolate reductase (NADPH)
MKQASDLGLDERTAMLGGIIVPKNVEMLNYMNNFVAGVAVPKKMIDRFQEAKDKAQGEAVEAHGKRPKKTDKKARSAWAKAFSKIRRKYETPLAIEVAAELINDCRQVPGVKGVHIQAIEWEAKVREVVEKAGLVPRPTVPAAAAAAG